MPTDQLSGLAKQIMDWAAWLVAALAGLLYAQGRDKAREDKDAYTRELAAFRVSLDRCITSDDFDKHEEREAQDRAERREAERVLFNKIDDVNGKLHEIIGKLDK